MNTLRNSLNKKLVDFECITSKMNDFEDCNLNLIASDNYYTDLINLPPLYKGQIIQEGIIGTRPFAGAKLHDKVELLAQEIVCEIFDAEHANLQPHSCSQANQAAYMSVLNDGDTVLSLDLKAGGHLTHGLKSNFSAKSYNFIHYGVDANDVIDYEQTKDLALKHQPKLLVCGSSSYPRIYDFTRLREIADEVGCYLMFDLSHEAGLVATGSIQKGIVSCADIVTMSVDKTLRGPFGG